MARTVSTPARTPSVGTIEGTGAGASLYDDDERAPFRHMCFDADDADDDDDAGSPSYPYLSRETMRDIARATSRAAGLPTYTWEETFGDGWRDRGDRFWDIRRTCAMSDTTDYSECPTASDHSDDDGDGGEA